MNKAPENGSAASARSAQMKLAEVDGRSLPQRQLDGTARIVSACL